MKITNDLSQHAANFKGLLTLSAPNKDNNITINTDSVSSIYTKPYYDKVENSMFSLSLNQGATISLTNGAKIRTFLPAETVIDAYKKAQSTGEYKLETKYSPVVEKNWL